MVHKGINVNLVALISVLRLFIPVERKFNGAARTAEELSFIQDMVKQGTGHIFVRTAESHAQEILKGNLSRKSFHLT
jgi:hypothetical protein